jgi:putative solute:sodium symporter small subunit|tara:strand:+ start:1815 stop:2120 length:306 start_codon:yes stop_codon:yes gene_type:complete
MASSQREDLTRKMENKLNQQERRKAYWRSNLRILAALMSVWFIVSFGCGILFVDTLNKISIGGSKLGFWMAQQGSIYVFVILIFIYVSLMNKLDRKYKFNN